MTSNICKSFKSITNVLSQVTPFYKSSHNILEVKSQNATSQVPTCDLTWRDLDTALIICEQVELPLQNQDCCSNAKAVSRCCMYSD